MVSVNFTGDIAFSGFFKNKHNKKDILSDEIFKFLNDSDYVIANIECPITDKKVETDRVLYHVMGSDAVSTLKKMNAHIWNLGNNHILDCGIEGAKDTLEVAKKEKIRTVGLGLNKEDAMQTIILKGDVTIGIISLVKPWEYVKAGENSPGCIFLTDIDCIKRQINELKSKVDYIVAIIHAGDEFSNMPLPYDRKRYMKILDLGADIVVAHHPHVVQNYEKVGKKIIFYSLGNFIFDTEYQRVQTHTDKGILLNLKFTKEGYDWNYLPIFINREKETVESGKCPDIFTNITKNEYKILWPLAVKSFLNSNIKAEEYKDKLLTKSEVKLDILRRIKRKIWKLANRRELTLKLGNCLYHLHIWKLSKKKNVCNYMLEK